MLVVPSIHVSFVTILEWKVVEVGVLRGPGAIEGKGELLVVLVTWRHIKTVFSFRLICGRKKNKKKPWKP
jgi:hypothetical protein